MEIKHESVSFITTSILDTSFFSLNKRHKKGMWGLATPVLVATLDWNHAESVWTTDCWKIEVPKCCLSGKTAAGGWPLRFRKQLTTLLRIGKLGHGGESWLEATFFFGGGLPRIMTLAPFFGTSQRRIYCLWFRNNSYNIYIYIFSKMYECI